MELKAVNQESVTRTNIFKVDIIPDCSLLATVISPSAIADLAYKINDA